MFYYAVLLTKRTLPRTVLLSTFKGGVQKNVNPVPLSVCLAAYVNQHCVVHSWQVVITIELDSTAVSLPWIIQPANQCGRIYVLFTFELVMDLSLDYYL